jgi:hypothetical protein
MIQERKSMKTNRPVNRRLRFENLEGRVVLSANPAVQALPSVSHAATPVTSTSTNWSGYAVDAPNNSVSYVIGTWKVPAVTGTSTAYASVWVGIDGSTSNTVEQLGTDSVIYNGQPVYSAWYEMYPKSSVTIRTTNSGSNMVIAPGDSITASVRYDGSQYLLQMTDTTRGETFSTAQSLKHAARSSAEWIVEAPSGGGILPLANFGTATFTNCSATVSGVSGPINTGWSGTELEQINMVSGSTTEDTTGPLNNSGTGFSVQYVATANSAKGSKNQASAGGLASPSWQAASAAAQTPSDNQAARDQFFASLGSSNELKLTV